MNDPLSSTERSVQMARVKSSGNKSTEISVEKELLDAGLTGWEKHPKGITGKPDFYFPDFKILIFVDGCFWHSCPKCKRRIPLTNHEFWENKINENRKRDNRCRRKLRNEGFHVLRIWEHEIKKKTWLKRLFNMIRTINNQNNNSGRFPPQ